MWDWLWGPHAAVCAMCIHRVGALRGRVGEEAQGCACTRSRADCGRASHPPLLLLLRGKG